MLEVEADHDDDVRTFLIEYDRTRRVDKNFGKFRRYDALLNWWWHNTPYRDHDKPPSVVFLCQAPQQREQFMAVADRESTGHRWHPRVPPDEYEYNGRRRILFALERDMHAAARRLAPPSVPGRPSQSPGRSAPRAPARRPHEHTATADADPGSGTRAAEPRSAVAG